MSQPISVGFDNVVLSERIIAIVSPDSSPVERLIQQAKNDGKLIDAASGRKRKSVIITDAGYIVVSCLNPETIALRVRKTVAKK
jgi:regulator of extracellular matrix RemA (YlzA/DUF370 family)